MKKKTTFRDLAALLAFGAAASLLYYLVLGGIAVLLGLLVAAFSEISWYVAAVIAYLAIRLVLEVTGAIQESRPVRCTECKGKIMTSRPIKCEECGGAARLAGKKYPQRKAD